MRVIFRDQHLIVVHKPSGLTVYGDTRPGEKSAYDLLKKSLSASHDQALFPVHRLDKGTCGLLVFALSSKVSSLLQRDFKSGKIKKKYWALVFGLPPKKGIIQEPIIANKTKQKQTALTRFKRLGFIEEPKLALLGDAPGEQYLSWVECEPETGRYHQIRKHMKGQRNVLLGDVEYGGEKRSEWVKKQLGLKRIALSSVEIAFEHPVTKRKMILQTRPDTSLDSVIKKIEWTVEEYDSPGPK